MKKTLLITCLLLCMSVGFACAANVALINASYEAPELSRATAYTIGMGIIPTGWALLANGLLNPANDFATEYEGVESVWGFNLPAVDGVQTARMYGSGANGNGTYLYQNTGILIEAGQTIAISEWFVAYSTGSQALLSVGAATTPTGAWNSLIGGTPLFVASTGTWAQQSATITIAADDAAIGQYLCVGTRIAQGWAWYDNMTLDVTNAPVPEPSSLLLVGSGVAGLLGTVIRRRRA